MQLGSLLLAASFIVSGPNGNTNQQGSQRPTEGLPKAAPTRTEAVITGTVTAKFDVEVAAAEAGVLDKINVDVGDPVQKNTPLAHLNDEDIRLKMEMAKVEEEVAKMEAANEADVKAAEFTAGVALAEWEDSLRINKRSPGSIPPTQLRREELTFKRTTMQAEVAKLKFATAGKTAIIKGKQVAAAQLAVNRRQVKCRYDGVVEERFKDEGEWVSPGDRIFRVVHMDVLKVEGFLNFALYPPNKVKGRKVWVVFPGNGQTQRLEGEVVFTSLQIDALNQYQYRIEVRNRSVDGFYVLRPGMTVAIQFK